MRKICIIPARAGSKRIKDKNIKNLAGKPLVAWTIESVLDAKLFDDIILSTDSLDILKIGLSYKLKNFGLRPDHLADDYSTAADVIRYHIDDSQPAKVCYLQPTSPLRTSCDITSSYQLMEDKNANAVISVSPDPVPENWIYKKDDCFEEFINGLSTKRSQDYQPRYVLNGAIFWFDSLAFKRYGTHLISDNAFSYVMPRDRGLDIDESIDFLLAEHLLTASGFRKDRS